MYANDHNQFEVDNDSKRKARIVTFVRKYPLCTSEAIEKDPYVAISHTKLIELLNEMTREGTVSDVKEKKNSRSHRWVVNEENPLITIPQLLDEFGTAIISAIQACFKFMDDPTRKKSLPGTVGYFQENDLPTHIFEYYSQFLKAFILWSILILPQKVPDVEQRQHLQNALLFKIADINIRVSSALGTEPVLFRRLVFHLQQDLLNEPSFMYREYRDFSKYGIGNEIRTLFDTTWKITREIKDRATQDVISFANLDEKNWFDIGKVLVEGVKQGKQRKLDREKSRRGTGSTSRLQ